MGGFETRRRALIFFWLSTIKIICQKHQNHTEMKKVEPIPPEWGSGAEHRVFQMIPGFAGNSDCRATAIFHEQTNVQIVL